VASLLEVRDLNIEFAGASGVHHPAHPYTRGLLNSVPTVSTSRSKPLQTIEGMVPTSAALLPGCLFEPHCPVLASEAR
jgi:oligopeptide/dipeptide ABC transporter ATP-binding protein